MRSIRCAAFVAVSSICCADLGRYVWVENYNEPQATSQKPYTINVGDLVFVRVFNQDQLSAHVRVRPDGKISLPLLGDVEAVGATPVALSQVVENRLKELVKGPSVTVVVEESRSPTVTVMGLVGHPGGVSIDGSTGVLQALGVAGGISDDASSDRIFVLRQTPSPVRIRFSYDKLRKQEGRAAAFKLRHGDVVVVE